jgi:WD40 repeat protein
VCDLVPWTARPSPLIPALYAPEYKAAPAPVADDDSASPLELEHVIGFSGSRKNTLSCHPASDSVFVTALGAAVVIGDVTDPHQQAFLRGHDADVSVIAVSPVGNLIASGQLGSITSPVGGTGSRGVPRGWWGLELDLAVVAVVALAPDPEPACHCSEPTPLLPFSVPPPPIPLLSQGAESPVIVWDFATRRQLYNLFGMKHGVTQLTFSPDERFLAACGVDKMLFLWDMEVGSWMGTGDPGFGVGHGATPAPVLACAPVPYACSSYGASLARDRCTCPALAACDVPLDRRGSRCTARARCPP